MKPSSLEDYIRAVYKVGVENAQAERKSKPETDPVLAALLGQSKTNPADPVLKAQLADLYFQRRLYLQAYDVLMELHSKRPEDQQTNLQLAHIWHAWEQHGLALQHASRALDAGLQTAEGYALMGRIQLHLNKPDLAIAWYRKAVEKDAGNAAVLANLGYAYILRSEWQLAKPQLEAALALNNAMPEVHNNLAAVLAHLGDYDAALRHLMQAGSPPIAMNNMGVLYLQRNNTEEALRYFREALRLDPSYTTAQRNLQFAQMLTPPPATIHIPSFDTIPVEERSNAFLRPATPDAITKTSGSVASEAANASPVAPAPALPFLPRTAAEETISAVSGVEGAKPGTTAAVDDSTPAGPAISAAESATPGALRQRFETSRSRVWTALQQRRVRNLAGFAGLIILTGLLAFRARKWN